MAKSIFVFLNSLLYLYFYPIITLIDKYEYSDIIFDVNYIFFLILYPIVCVISFFIVKTFKINNCDRDTPRVQFNIKNLRYFTLVVLLILIILLSNTNLLSGVYFDRTIRDSGFFASQSWVILNSLLISIIFILIYSRNDIGRFYYYLLLLIFVLYLILDLVGLGGRRSIVAIILFYLCCIGYIDNLFKRKSFLLLYISFIVFGLTFGAAREIIISASSEADFINGFILPMMKYNEFTYIGSSIFRMANYSLNIDNLEFGATFLNAFSNFIPRIFYENKPESISVIYEINPSLPAELFINFGIFPSLLILSLIFLFLTFLFVSKLNSFFKCLLIAYTLDFLRADFSSIIFTLTVSLAVYLMLRIKL